MTGAVAFASVYVRQSTERQELDGQLRELEQEAARRGLTVTDRYLEKVSGTGRVYRAEFDRMLHEAGSPNRAWEYLLVWSLDRFSRAERFTEAITTILELERLGVRFISLREPYLETPLQASNPGTFDVRGLLLAVTSLVSSYESRRRAERTRLAMEEIKTGRRKTRSGRPVGRPRRVTPELLAKAGRLRQEGHPWAAVARRVGLPKETCRRALYEAKRTKRSV